jgi:hypothetical protein
LDRKQNVGRLSISKTIQEPLLVVEQAIETESLMLGTDKSRGYCLEMICAYFLAGANLENVAVARSSKSPQAAR